jgi:AmmeMemoRadiSam system protein B/AmmeMemoRadiSam system protein A
MEVKVKFPVRNIGRRGMAIPRRFSIRAKNIIATSIRLSTITCWLCLAVCIPGLQHPAMGQDGLREPVWSGTFYPAKGDELLRLIDQFTRQAQTNAFPVGAGKPLKALIMPHAGYVYSGSTAAHAARVLGNQSFDTVLLLGPDHRLGITNAALSSAAVWQTPLGRIRLHPHNRTLSRKSDLFRVLGLAEDREHSLEVILPFLQVYLEAFQLLPVILGPCNHRKMGDFIDRLLDDRTLLVVSADLSHYLPYNQAVLRDRSTIQAILDLDSGPVLGDDNRTCGKHPMAVLLHLARKHHWQPFLLAYANSGDTTGDHKRVVGYAAIAFFGEMPMSSHEATPLDQSQGQALLLLARNTLLKRFNRQMSELQKARMENRLEDPPLQEPCGTFVTLKIGGQLRGCIGSLTGTESIIGNVRSNAINAAFHDPRFRALTAEELDRVVIEVSVLTEPKPMDYTDAEDLRAKLRPDIDGVTIRKGSASATFLPQVWQQLPKVDAFLSQLCMKAGLAAEAWRRDRLDVETYQVQCFEEDH